MKRFCRNGLIEKNKSDEDKRAAYITLTEKGIVEAERLIHITNNQIKTKISGLGSDECDALCDALNIVIEILGKEE